MDDQVLEKIYLENLDERIIQYIAVKEDVSFDDKEYSYDCF